MEHERNVCKVPGGIVSFMKIMELRHLRSFLAVAEELNFRRAAERLFITQPPLTRQIQELEREMGVALFERVGKKIRLTEAGEYLTGEARLMLDRADEVKRQAQAVEQRENSRLRIGFVEYVLQTFLPDVFKGILEVKPTIGIELFEMSSEYQVDALLHDRIDVGILRHWGKVEGLEYRALVSENLIAICSAKQLDGKPLTALRDLSDLPFIAFSRSGAPGLVARIEEAFFRVGFLPKTVFEGGQLDTIRRLVSSGLGWAIIPSSALLPHLEIEEVVELALEDENSKIELGMAWRTDTQCPNIELLLDMCLKTVKLPK